MNEARQKGVHIVGFNSHEILEKENLICSGRKHISGYLGWAGWWSFLRTVEGIRELFG